MLSLHNNHLRTRICGRHLGEWKEVLMKVNAFNDTNTNYITNNKMKQHELFSTTIFLLKMNISKNIRLDESVIFCKSQTQPKLFAFVVSRDVRQKEEKC